MELVATMKKFTSSARSNLIISVTHAQGAGNPFIIYEGVRGPLPAPPAAADRTKKTATWLPSLRSFASSRVVLRDPSVLG